MVQYVSVGPTRIQRYEVVYIRGVDIAVRIARSDHVATASAFLRQNTTIEYVIWSYLARAFVSPDLEIIASQIPKRRPSGQWHDDEGMENQ